MGNKDATAQKRWFSDGAGMVYSRGPRMSAWLLNLFLYTLLCMFYQRVQTGTWLGHKAILPGDFLIEQLLAPLNIFYFPTQIIVIALVMALICVVPILTSQLYNVLYAVPFVLVMFLLSRNLPLSFCLFVSCAAVGFRPMRFKSKFVAALLCLLPEVLYGIIFRGDNPEQNILRWAVLYAPWALALLVSVLVIGLVIGIGHFLRYRPGVLTPVFGLLLAGAVLLFHYTIGMSERDFQADVYRYSPDQIKEFQDRSIVPLLEEELAQRLKQEPYLKPELVKEDLRRQWRQAYLASRLGGLIDLTSKASREFFMFYQAKLIALDHIDSFMDRYPQDRRLSAALFYKALLFDLSVDFTALRDEDALRFYHDIPLPESQKFWSQLLERFAHSAESIEARLRLARIWAGQKPKKPTDSFNFPRSLDLLEEARKLCAAVLQERTKPMRRHSYASSWREDIFRKPPSPLSNEELTALQVRIIKLMTLIGKENRTGHVRHEERLAEFVGLDVHQLNYSDRLQELMMNSPQPDPLLDNIELAQALLIRDGDERIIRLSDLASRYESCDGGIEAMLELAQALLNKYHRSEYQADREVLRTRSQELLQKICDLRPDSPLVEYARQMLQNLPALP